MRSIKNHLMNKLLTIIFTVFSCCNISLFAQTVDKQESVTTFKNDSVLVISNDSSLNNFFKKLDLLEKGQIDRLNIIHVGNSHTQAGFITGEIRNILQNRFGNAGRGLVFSL